MSDHDVIFGFHVFALKRMVGIAQFAFGSLILTNLIGRERKHQIHLSLQEAAQQARTAKPPRKWRVGRIVFWLPIVLFAISANVATFQSSHYGFPMRTTIQLAIAYFIVLGLMGVPLVFAVREWIDMILTTIYVGKRFLPPIAASLLHQERFDRNMTLISFVGLLVVSFGQLMLS